QAPAGFPNPYHFALLRYNAGGSLDDGSATASTPGDSFGTGGHVITGFDAGTDFRHGGLATAVAIQADGKIVAAGEAFPDRGDFFALARFNTDGTLDDGSPDDTTHGDRFGTAGEVTTSFGFAVNEVSDLVIQ